MHSLTCKKIKVPLILAVMLMAILGSAMTASAAKKAEGTKKYQMGADVLQYLNEERTKAGVKKVKQDEYLNNIAMERAAELSIEYSHYRPDGSYFTSAGNSKYLKAENIAYGYSTAKEANTAWTNSAPHYKTMTTASYTGVGIACFEAADGTMYWVEEFGVYQSPAKIKKDESNCTAKGKTVKVTDLTNKASGIQIKWSKVTGVSGYYVYRKTSGGSYQKIATIKKDSKVQYTDKTVKNKSGTKYRYKVVAYTKSDGKKSSGKTKDICRVSRPTSTAVTSNVGGCATVTWKKVKNASGYRVYYSTDKNFNNDVHWQTEEKGSTTSHTFSSLKEGQKYYFKVDAYITKSGEKYYSAASTVISTTISSDSIKTPTIKSAKSESSGKATVTWRPVSGVTGYKIYYSTDKTFSGTKWYYTAKGADASSYVVPNLDKGKQYYFYVVAYKEQDGQTYSSKKSSIVSCTIKS